LPRVTAIISFKKRILHPRGCKKRRKGNVNTLSRVNVYDAPFSSQDLAAHRRNRERMKRFFSLAGVLCGISLFAADVPSRDPALIWAARNNLSSLAAAMLARGAEVNEQDIMGNTPLHWAVKYPAMVRFLLENGADVNARNLLGETALHLAVRYKGSVEILLEKGADKTIRTVFGRTAVDYCMDHGTGKKNLEVMSLLYAE
jgi:ankyrin repeat protein